MTIRFWPGRIERSLAFLSLLAAFRSSIAEPATAPLSTPKFLYENDGLEFYENGINRGISTLQYQLNGNISWVRVVNDSLIFSFKGHVKLRTASGEHYDPTEKRKVIAWDVTDLTIKISHWKIDAANLWGPNSFTFEDTIELAHRLEREHGAVEAAIKTAKFVFFQTGDLLAVEGEQIYFEDVKR